MTSEFHTLEESLKQFLIDAQSDNYNSRNTNFHKYNNLKIYANPAKNQTPHFIVRIGISEAMYDIAKREKLDGGLGSDERLVRRWIDRMAERFDISSIWASATKTKVISTNEEDDDD